MLSNPKMEVLMKRVMKDELKRRNLVTIRLSDAEMKVVVDLAWNQRRSVADLTRECMFNYLKSAYNVQPVQTVLQEVKTI
jgi:hypothetical protein